MVLFLIAVAVVNLLLGFGLAVFLHHAPDLDSESLQSPVVITSLSTPEKRRLPSIRFRSPFSAAIRQELDAEAARMAALDQGDGEGESPDSTEQDLLAPSRTLTRSRVADHLTDLPLAELVRSLAADLQLFSDANMATESKVRKVGSTDPRGVKGETIAPFWRQSLEIANRQRELSIALQHVREANEAARELALSLSEYVHDWASEITSTACHYLTTQNLRCKISMRQLCCDLQRIASLAFALRDQLDDARCQLPPDPTCELTHRLTGLDNRIAFETIFVDFQQRAHRNSQEFCAAILDIDRFHLINTQWGLRLGDLILREIAQALLNAMPVYFGTGRFLHLRHSTFVVLLDQPLQTSVVDALESLRQSIEATTVQLPHDECNVTISCGIVPATANSPRELLDKLRQALGYAQLHGKNRTAVVESTSTRLIEPAVRDVQADCLHVTASAAL